MDNNIKEIREKRGLKQCELAEISGVSRTIINQLETGVRENITTKTMQKIARALNVEISDIFFVKVV